MVGILVEEALCARSEFDLKNSHDLIRKKLFAKENNMYNSTLNYNDLDELISDKGIIYNTKKYNHNSKDESSEPREKYNEELFKLFKQFILFQKMIKE